MHFPSYLYNSDSMTAYTFTSVGRRRIEKMVEFTNVGIENVYNLAFGDLLPNGTIDDTSNSNNGDIVKVLATVINILKDFTEKTPKAYIRTDDTYKQVEFDPEIKADYEIFIVKRIS